jgi:hypothetical protein
MHAALSQLLRRQLWGLSTGGDQGFAGLLRRDEGGDFQPAHEIRDEGIRIHMHNR